jgi:ABC-type branched-subunit amino acid transport system ATPase component
MLLEVAGISKTYGGVHAVDNLSFGIDRNEAVGLIGPNGAGKSTVIALVSGFNTADSGTVLFDGQDVTRQDAYLRARRGLVRTFQLARVWGRLSVMENMLVAASNPSREALWRQFVPSRARRTAENRDRVQAREILADFDLLRLKDLPAAQLSGGQKRLLEFARIVVARPRLVLLDEPTASLSPTMSKRVGESIRYLVAAGIAVLLIEHDTALAEAVCPRILCMAAGRLIAEGSMAHLRRNSEVVEAYLGTGLRTKALAFQPPVA